MTTRLLPILLLAACAGGGPGGTLAARGTVEGREVTIRSEAGGRVVAAGSIVDRGLPSSAFPDRLLQFRLSIEVRTSRSGSYKQH